MQNSSHRLRLIAFLTCFVAFFVCQGRADELKNIQEAASQMPSLLKGYHVSFDLRGGPTDPREYQKCDIWQSGSNIKTVTTLIFPEGKKFDPLLKPVEYAFNGIDYQWLATGVKSLTFSKKCRHPNPYWTQNPLMVPYYWVAGQQTNWSDIKDIARWNERFNEAEYVGSKIENGVHFEVVSFPFPQMDLDRIHVHFAKDLHYYPLKALAYKDGLNNGLPVMKVLVTQHKILDIDEMPFVFPLSVELHAGLEDDSKEDRIDGFWTVDEQSIKINPPIDEDLFTISPSRATTVTDYDHMLESGAWLPSTDVADDGRDIVPEPLPKQTWSTQRIVAVVVINLILLSLLLYFLLRKK